MVQSRNKKEEKRTKRKAVNIFVLFILAVVGIVGLYFCFFQDNNTFSVNRKELFIASNQSEVTVYDEEGKEIEKIVRGAKVVDGKKKVTLENDVVLQEIKYDKKTGFVQKENLVEDKNKSVQETDVYVRTPQNLYHEQLDGSLLGLVSKGEVLKVIGFDKLNKDGTVSMYKVKRNEEIGYIYSKYVVLNKEEALLHYEPDKYYTMHEARGNHYGGGSAANLDYYPVDKPTFEENPMPNEVYAFYLNSSKEVIANVDKYIELAKTSKINAFVVDIKDNESSAYPALAMEKYSKTNYEKSFNTKEEYQNAIHKLKEAGFYVIGRITVFKDKYYAMDHPEHSLLNTNTQEFFLHYDTYWPSPYQRAVWEFNVALAKEAVQDMGFNEIQFDYVRFPDRTKALETAGKIDFRNIYQEEKAQAIQRFLQYATDELHKQNVYVSADVFGESAHSYVTAYGQYFPAISNVVDVISAMPYPDHFNKYEYGFKQPVWSIPYDVLNYWGKNYVMKRQEEIPTPAICRTWIQTYDTIREPYITYGAKEVEQQIKGLYDAGLKGGYMTWNSGSNLQKYKSQINAYSKEYSE